MNQCQKLMVIVCQKCLIANGHLAAVYKILRAGVGPSYRENKHNQVRCLEFVADMAVRNSFAQR